MPAARRCRLFSALLCATLLTTTLTAGASAREPVTLKVAFDRSARLGGDGALHADLRIDPQLVPAPASELQLLVPDGIGITTSGLGIAACRRPARDFEQVVIEGGPVPGLAGCPRNAVLGSGLVRALVRLGDPGETPTIVPEIGRVTILAGPFRDGQLQLVTLVLGENPLGALFAYAGEARPLELPWGDSLWIRIPQLPLSTFSAAVALLRLDVVIGDVIYYRRPGDPTTAYRPDGIAIPSRCPRGGFRFGVEVGFADGSRHRAYAAAPCPPPPAAVKR